MKRLTNISLINILLAGFVALPDTGTAAVFVNGRMLQNQGAPASAPALPGTGPFIEEIYKISLARAEKSRVDTSGPLMALLAVLEVPYEQSPARIDTTITEILKFKEVATRSLLAGLRAPLGSPRAANCARALARSSDPLLFADIEGDLQTAPPEARSRIAWLLGRQPVERAAPILQKLAQETDPVVAGNAALSLGNLKHKDSARLLGDRLEKSDAALGRNILTALGMLEDAAPVAHIQRFLNLPQGADCVGALADAVRGIRSKELLPSALKTMMKWRGTAEENLSLARAIRDNVSSSDKDAIALMKKILTEVQATREVQDEIAFGLHFAKDPGAKNFLLQDVNDRLKENPDNDKVLRRRAKIYLRLKMYTQAAKDHEDVRRLAKNKSNNINIDGEFWIEMARAHAGNKGFQSAADFIRNAMSGGMRPGAFRDYEEFTEMKKQSRFAPLFDGND